VPEKEDGGKFKIFKIFITMELESLKNKNRLEEMLKTMTLSEKDMNEIKGGTSSDCCSDGCTICTTCVSANWEDACTACIGCINTAIDKGVTVSPNKITYSSVSFVNSSSTYSLSASVQNGFSMS
jgi:hypothetical protein